MAVSDIVLYVLQVSIYLPPLRLLKSVVDRMKNLSCYLVSNFTAVLLSRVKL